MSVHYKFKSSLDYDTITYDGLHISVGDLKKAILAQKKIGKGFDFDLQITNAQTKEIYSDDEALIPKNASVIVSRVPNSLSAKKAWERNDSSTLLPVVAQSDGSDSMSFDKVTKNADLVSSNVSEDEKIRTMMSQSTQDYDPSRYVKTKGMSGPIPPNYTCFRCGRAGHWIKNCPTNSLEVKRSTGIPRSFMVTVEGPEVPGALLTSSGQFAVPMIDHEAYKEGKKERPPFFKEMSPEKEQVPQVPEELLCMICRDLLSDAVLIPCCGNSYCDECVRQALLDSDEHECPTCHEKDISPDTLIPNRFLRTAVMNFKNETGYTKIKKPIIKTPPSMTADIPAADLPDPAPAEGVEPDSQMDVNLSTPATVDASQPAPANGSSQVSVTSTTDEHPGTPVRDEHLDGDAVADVSGTAGDFDDEKNEEDVESKDRALSPVTYSNPITTITTRLRMSPLMPMTMPVMPQKPRPKPPPILPAPISTPTKPPPLMSQETNLRLPPTMSRDSSGTLVRLGSQQTRLDASLSYVTPSSTSLPLLPLTTTGPPTYTTPTYSTPPPTLKPPPPGIMMPPLGMLPPPPGHLMGMPPHFSHAVRHPPPPIPSMFHGPPPMHPGMRRPMLPPPGPNPLGGSVQPLPPGVRPMLPPLLPPGDAYRHHQPMEPYPPRQDDYYRDHRPYPDRDRSNYDPMDAFTRELSEYRPRRRRSRRRSASSSRSCSSRSGYHSCSPSTRSRSRSARSSRSRSISYSSRSRSSSPNYSHSPYSQRSRSQSHSRSRSRSRSKAVKYLSPSHRKSRSHSPRGRRSPHPPPPPPPRRRRDYSPNYYHNVYRGPPQPMPPQQMNVPPYEMPPRGRYADPYRYENYRYEEDPRYPMRDARYDYSHYDEYYHRGGMHANRGHRGWSGHVPGKSEDHRPPARPMREGGPRRGAGPPPPPPPSNPPPSHRSRSPLANQNEKEPIGGREREREREWNSRRYPEKSRGYREVEQEQKDMSGPNYEPIGTRKPRKVRESGSEEKEKDKSVMEKEKKVTPKPIEERSSRSSAVSDKDKAKDKHHKRKVHHHGSGKGESPAKKVKVSKKGSEVEAAPTSDSPSATSRKSARKKKKKVKEGGDAESSSKSESPNKEIRKASKGSKDGNEETSKVEKVAHTSAGDDRKGNMAIQINIGMEPIKSHEPLVDYKENEGTEEQSDNDSANVNLDEEMTKDDRKKDVEKTASQQDIEVPRIEVKEDELMLSVGAEELVEEDEKEEHRQSSEAENVLTAPVPELSKWELDDVEVNRQEDVSSQSYAKQRYKGKPDSKHSLPPDIVQRAEKAILQKALKGIVPTTETTKVSRKTVENKAFMEKEDEPVAKEEATLKVSIDNGSSKRVVEKTSKEVKEGRDRVRLDRSKFIDAATRNDSPNRSSSGQKSTKDDERRDKSVSVDGRSKEHKGEGVAGKGRSSHDIKGSGRHQRMDSAERNARSGRPEEKRGGARYEDFKGTRRSQERERRSHSQERYSGRERSGGDRGEARGRGNQYHAVRRDVPTERERHEDDRHAGSRSRDASQKNEKEGRRTTSSPDKNANKRKELETEGRHKRTGTSKGEEEEKKDEDERRMNPTEGVRLLPRDRRSSTIDESKFEPDYDDTDESVLGGSKLKAAAATTTKEVEAKKRRSSSSASTASSAASSRGSSSPTAVKKRKSSPSTEVKSKHKKSKHKKHKKHKHKHKKNKKNKQKDEEKESAKGVKSIVKH